MSDTRLIRALSGQEVAKVLERDNGIREFSITVRYHRTMPAGYQETIPILTDEVKRAIEEKYRGGHTVKLPVADPAHRSQRPDTGIWPSTAAFMAACIFAGCAFILYRAGVFR